MIAIMPGTPGMRTCEFFFQNSFRLRHPGRWSKVRRKFRLTSIMLESSSNMSLSSSPETANQKAGLPGIYFSAQP